MRHTSKRWLVVVQEGYVGILCAPSYAKANLWRASTVPPLSTQHSDFKIYAVRCFCKTTFGQCRTHLILSIRWKLGPDLINTGGLVITLYFLLKITDLKILS